MAMFFTACSGTDETIPTERPPTETPVSTEIPTEAPSEDVQAEAAVVRVNLGQIPFTLDPARVAPLDGSANDLVENLFAGLARLNPDEGRVEPFLARDWELMEDGRTWHVFLRDDVYWVRIDTETGEMTKVRPVVANDVVSAVERSCLAETGASLGSRPGIFSIQGCRELYERDPADITEIFIEQNLGVRVLNDVAVEFTMINNNGIFPTLLAFPLLHPVPAELVEEYGDEWTHPENIWASGPYVLQPSIPVEEGYTLVANDHWPLERFGNVEAVQISFRDSDEMFSAWEQGEIDVTTIHEEQLSEAPFEDSPAYRLLAQPATIMMVFTYETSPLDNRDVRLALSLALNRTALVREALLEEGEAAISAASVTPPGMVGYPDYRDVELLYDPDAARAALSSAGYENCEGLPEISILIDNVFPASERLAEAAIRIWERELQCEDMFVVERQELFDVFTALQEPTGRVQSTRPGIILLGWQADYPDAHHWLTDVYACSDLFPTAYVNQARDCIDAESMLLDAATEIDEGVRAEIYADIRDAFFATNGEMPVIPIYHHARALAINPWVEVYPLHAGALRFDEWRVDTNSQP